jgi:hypothetical protein
MSKLSKRRNIISLENANGCHMGRMDQLSDACEGDKKSCPQAFEIVATILMIGIMKPYYRRYVSPKFPWI